MLLSAEAIRLIILDLQKCLPNDRPIKITIDLQSGSQWHQTIPPGFPALHVGKPGEPEPVCKHSPDFRCVNWFGVVHSFSAAQSRIVQLLWRAWEEKLPDISGEYLLEETESESNSVRDVFKDHSAWGAMIAPGGSRGTFRLANSKTE